MPAGSYTNSITALNGIYGALSEILKYITDNNSLSNKDKETNKNKEQVKALNQGGLNDVNVKGSAPLNITKESNVTLQNVASALLSLPPAIKAIIALDSKMPAFERVLLSLSESLNKFSQASSEVKGAENLVSLAQSLKLLQDIKFFSLMLSFTVADKAKVGEKMGKVLADIVKGFDSLDKFKLENKTDEKIKTIISSLDSLSKIVLKMAILTPVIPIFDLSVLMLYPGIIVLGKIAQKLSDERISKNFDNTIKGINSLIKGLGLILIESVAIGLIAQKVGLAPILKGLGITLSVLAVLSGITVGLAALMGRTRTAQRNLHSISRFITSLVLLTGAIIAFSLFVSSVERSLWPGLAVVGGILLGLSALAIAIAAAGKIMHINRELNRLSRFISGLVLMTAAVMALAAIATIGSAVILPGLGIIAGILLGLTLIAALTSLLAVAINLKAMREVMLIAAFGMALVLGTMLIGALVSIPGAVGILLAGLATVTGIILSYTLIAYLAGILGATIDLINPLLKNVIVFAGMAMALVMGTMLIGALVSLGWDLLILGLVGVAGTVAAYIGIAKLMRALGKELTTLTPAIKDILLFAGSSLLITLGVIAIGALIHKVGIGWTLAGIAAFSLILAEIYGTAVLVSKIEKSKVLHEALPGLLYIGLFAGEIAAITGGLVLVASKLQKVDPKAVVATFLLFGVILKTALMLAEYGTTHSRTFKKGAKDIQDALLIMAAGELLVGGIIGLAYAFRELGSLGEASARVGIIFGLLTATITEATILAKLASKHKDTIQQGAKDYLSAMLIIGASEVIVGGIIGLAYLIKGLSEDGNIASGTIAVGIVFGLMAAVIAAAAGISKLAQKTAGDIKAGAVSLLLAEGVLLSSAIVLGAILLLTKKREGINPESIADTLLIMSTIVTGCAVIAKLASKFKSDIVKGTGPLLLAEAIALGAAVVLAATIKVAKKADELGPGGFGKIFATLGAMVTIVAAFGAIAIGAGFLVAGPQAAMFFLGIATLGLAEIIALGSAGVLAATIEVAKKADELGPGGFGKIFATLGAMVSVVAAFGAIGTAIGLAAPFIAIGTLSMKGVVKLSNSSKTLLENAIEIQKQGTDFNKTIFISKLSDILTAANELRKLGILLPKIGVTAGTVAAAGIASLSKSIIKIVQNYIDIQHLKETTGIGDKPNLEFVIGILKGYSEISENAGKHLLASLAGVATLNKMAPVYSSLFNTIEQYINISEKLKTIDVSPTDFANQMKDLLGILNPKMFLDVFDEEGIIRTSRKINKGFDAYKKMIKIVRQSLDLFTDFAKKSRNVNLNNINLPAIATSISSAIEIFMDNLKEKTFKVSDKKTIKRMSEALGSLISPVSGFADVLSKFNSSDGKTLKSIYFDNEGKAHEGVSVNVENVARVLSLAITAFCSGLYNDNNKEMWKSLIEGKTKKTGSNLEQGIGVFASIVDPVAKFAEVLSKFESGGEGILIIPEYDEKGNLKPSSRKINVHAISSLLANAVTAFINELYVVHAPEWTALLQSINTIEAVDTKKGDELSGNESGIKDAIGIFGEILNPIINFAGVLEKFGVTKNGSLAIIDSKGNLKEVDVLSISQKLGSAVTDFVTNLSGVFNDDMIAKISLMKENSGNIITIIADFANNFSALAQNDYKNLDKNVDIITLDITKLISSIKSSFESDNNISDKAILESDTITTIVSKFSSIFGRLSNEDFSNLNKNIDELIIGLSKVTGVIVETAISDEKIKSFNDIYEFINKLSMLQNVNAVGTNLLNMGNAIATTAKISQDSLFGFSNVLDIFRNTIMPLADEENITSIEAFNRNFETLATNISSASQTSNVKRLDAFSTAVKKSSSEMTKFDSVLAKNKDKRIKDLKEFGNALKEITTNVNNNKEALGSISTLFQAMNGSDPEKLTKVVEAFNKINGGGFGGGGTTINYNRIAIAFAAALNAIFDGAQFDNGKSGSNKTQFTLNVGEIDDLSINIPNDGKADIKNAKVDKNQQF